MAANLPSGTVTFLFTDIEGSMKVAQEHRDAWEDLRGRHHAILEEAMVAHGGHVFQIIGDAFCVAFRTAGEALEAAVEAQRKLQAEPWGEARIKVRMGMHTGTAQASGEADLSGGYTGYSAMARTQRVMSTAHGEQILLSITSADLLTGELPAGVTLKDMERHRLKGLVNPEHLWQVLAAGLVQEFPALQTLDGIPNNIPLQLTSFIGREKEIGEIKQLVERGRLVTLTGSGGVGKTRHALQVAAELLDSFEDGAWLIELAAVSEAALVLPALASALGVREEPGRPLMDIVQDHLRRKKALLLFDDCEHLLDECAQTADALLHACPNLKILVTSREALGTSGEVAYRVPSLSLPDPEHLPTLEMLSQFDSVRLFIERAVAAKSDFEVTNDSAPALAQVCARLDGIPLAIELAAARVKGLSIEQIAQRLDDRFRLLTGGSRTALPRRQTLRAMIEWSYELLSESERTLLRRLAVFVSNWSLEAAEAVCGRSGSGEPLHAGKINSDPEVMDLLLRLVDKSLVAPHEEGGQARYRMLETIQQFAHEKLSDSGELEGLQARHLEFFLSFSEQAEAKLLGGERWAWLRQSRAEYENLRTGLEWARGSAIAPPAPRLAFATEHLADVQRLLGVGTKALPLYQEALKLRQGADPAIAERLHEKIIHTVADLFLHVDSDKFQAIRHEVEGPRAALLQRLEEAKEPPPSGDKVRVLVALAVDAVYLRLPRDWSLGEEYARAAVEAAEKLDSKVDLFAALGALGDVLALRGCLREVAQLDRRRIALSQEVQSGDAQDRAMALISAADDLQRVGEYAEALGFVAEGADLAAEAQRPGLERAALDLRARCLLWLDRWDDVLSLDERMRDMRRRYPRELIGPSCYSVSAIARIHALRGESDLARQGRNEADAIMTAVIGPHEKWMPFQHY